MSIYYNSLILLVLMWKHIQIRSWNEPVLSHECKVTCGSLWWGFKLTYVQLQSDVLPVLHCKAPHI